jgi:hypothetical protein
MGSEAMKHIGVLRAICEGYFPHGAEQRAALNAAISQLAAFDRQAAEVEYAREILAKALDAGNVKAESLRTLATRAANALYWRDQAKQESESRLAEAVGLLKKLIDIGAIPGPAKAHVTTYLAAQQETK